MPPRSTTKAKATATNALQEELRRLRTLVDATKLINASIDSKKLYDTILDTVRRELQVERATLFLVDRERAELVASIEPQLGVEEIRLRLGQGIAGTVAATGESVVIVDAYSDARFDGRFDAKTGFQTRSILCAPIRSKQGIVGVLELMNKRDGEFTRNDLEFLESLSEHIAIALENALLHISLVAKNRMERELQLGQEIQERLLPPPPTHFDGTEIVARCLPCYEVSGDFYDFTRLDDGELGVAFGDVSGKGVSSALVTSTLQGALRMAAPMEPNLERLARRLNALVLRLADGSKFVTLFFARYQPATGRLTYFNAGHQPAILLADDKIVTLDATGMPIGLDPDFECEILEATIPPGGRLYLFTDGFTEAVSGRSNGHEMLGADRWYRMLRGGANRSPRDLCNYLFAEVARFERGAPPTDDKTLVIISRPA